LSFSYHPDFYFILPEVIFIVPIVFFFKSLTGYLFYFEQDRVKVITPEDATMGPNVLVD
jgi:hypothetical protein